MPDFATTPPIPYVPISEKATEVRAAIDVPQLSANNSFGGLQKLAIPGPFATDTEASTGGVPDDNLYYRSDGTVRAASHLSLDLAFALDKTLTARIGPTPVLTRASSGLFTNADGILVGKTAGTTTSITPSITANGTSVTVTVASGSVVGWLVGQSVSLIVDTDGGNDNDATELWLVGTIVSTTATELVFTVTSATTQTGSATAWTLGYRGARFDHDAAGVCKGLLIEEPRTNYVLNSQDFQNWAIGSVVSRNKELTIADPSGAFTSNRMVATSTFGIYQDGVIGVPNGTRSISIYARAVTGGLNQISIKGTGTIVRVNLVTGDILSTQGIVAGSAVAQQVGSIGVDGYSWYRISFVPVSTTTASLYLETDAFTGTRDVYLIWGAQYELGAFATSYIPTTSGTAVRSVDVCSITGGDFSGFYNNSAGTIVGDLVLSDPAQITPILFRSFLNEDNKIQLGVTNTAGAAIRPFVVSGGTSTYSSNQGTTIAGSPRKVALAYAVNDAISCLNGTLGTQDGTVTPPTGVTVAQIGSGLTGTISRIQYFKKRLSNAKLQTLTTL